MPRDFQKSLSLKGTVRIQTPLAKNLSPKVWHGFVTRVFHRLKTGATRVNGIGSKLLVCALVMLAGGRCAVVREQLANHYVRRGEHFLERQNVEAALASFQEASMLAPHLAVAHSKMGTIYRQLGEYDQAIDCFVGAVRRDPSSFEDSFDVAQLYHFMDRIREAIQSYLHAVELRPDDFDAQLNLGVCYQQGGDLTQAVERFQQAIELDPDRSHAYVNLGAALDAQQKYYGAIRAYKEALERDSTQPLVLVNLAQTYMKQDRLKMARLGLQKAIQMDTNLSAAHEAMGYCLFRLRDFDAAQQAYETALTCDWRAARAHAGLGSIHMLRYLEDGSRTEQHARAIEHWHRSLELEPAQPRIRKLIDRYKPQRTNPEAVLLDDRPRP